MKRIIFIVTIFIFCIYTNGKSQTITNGDFSSSGTGRGGSPEATNNETTYGGSVGTNKVAEVDFAAGLCQTISGFVVGSLYTLSFDCTRRTGGCPSPNPTNMNVTVSAGALSTTVSRSNTTFGFTNTSINFTATATSQTLTFAAGSGFGTSTCGMIVDNISITLLSPLPIELTSFNAILNSNKVDLTWETATETNNDYFTVEKSKDGVSFEEILNVKGAGNSTSMIDYMDKDSNPFTGVSYYRLKQTDFNGEHSYSNIVPVEYNPNGDTSISLFPNPTDIETGASISLNQLNGQEVLVVLRDMAGNEVFSKVVVSGSDKEIVALDPDGKLAKGTYWVIASSENKFYSKKLIVK